MALAGSAWLSLAAVAAAGLATSLLWPGVVSLASARFPLAGDLTPERIGLRVGVALAAVPAVAMLVVLAAWTRDGRMTVSR